MSDCFDVATQPDRVFSYRNMLDSESDSAFKPKCRENTCFPAVVRDPPKNPGFRAESCTENTVGMA